MAVRHEATDAFAVPAIPRRASTTWSRPADVQSAQRPVGPAEIRVSAWQEPAPMDWVDPGTEDTPATAVPGAFRFDIELLEDGTTEATALPDEDDLVALGGEEESSPGVTRAVAPSFLSPREDGTTEATALPDEDDLADLARTLGGTVAQSATPEIQRSTPATRSAGATVSRAPTAPRRAASGPEPAPAPAVDSAQRAGGVMWMVLGAGSAALGVLALAWGMGWVG